MAKLRDLTSSHAVKLSYKFTIFYIF